MYDENERNERHDQDVDYTEGAYSDSAYEEKNNDTAKKEETSAALPLHLQKRLI